MLKMKMDYNFEKLENAGPTFSFSFYYFSLSVKMMIKYFLLKKEWIVTASITVFLKY